MDTIVISKNTNSVYKNQQSKSGLSINFPEDVNALYWIGVSGWLEQTNGKETIDSLPKWAVDAISEFEKPEPQPSPEEVIKQIKTKALGLLIESDWTQLPDVNLSNKNEWSNYRSSLREIAKNPSVGSSFPQKPNEIWG